MRDCILCQFQMLAAAEGLESLVGPVRTVISTGSSSGLGVIGLHHVEEVQVVEVEEAFMEEEVV